MRNEGKTIKNLLESLRNQTHPVDEIIIVDSGSEDDTVRIINEYKFLGLPIKLIISKGCNRAQGRNIGIGNSSNELIVLIDGGCVASPIWIEELLANLDSDVDVVSGTYLLQVNTFQDRIIQLGYLPNIDKLKSETFLPSARSMLVRKNAWKKVGGFPEWLETAEDTCFDLRLRHLGAKFKLAKRASVSWNVCDSLGHLFRKKYNYGVGEGYAGLLFRKSTLVELFFSFSLMVSIVIALLSDIWLLPIFIISFGITVLFLLSLYRIFIYHEVKKWKFEEILGVYAVSIGIILFHLIGVLVGVLKKIRKTFATKFHLNILVTAILALILVFFVLLVVEVGIGWLNTSPKEIPRTTFFNIYQFMQYVSFPLILLFIFAILWIPPILIIGRKFGYNKSPCFLPIKNGDSAKTGIILLSLSLLTCFLTRLFPYLVYDLPIGYDVPAYLLMIEELIAGVPLQKFLGNIGHYLPFVITLGPFIPFKGIRLKLTYLMFCPKFDVE